MSDLRAVTSTFGVNLDGERLEYHVEGEMPVAEGGVMAIEDGDLLSRSSWYAEGSTVAPLFAARSEYDGLVEGIRRAVQRLAQSTLGKELPDFRLEEYHRYFTLDSELHYKVVDRTRDMPFSDFPVDLKMFAERISRICGIPLSTHNPALDHDWFQIRIVRPGSGDYNPPHRDAYLDFYRRIVNLYIPIAASDERTAMPVTLGSHLWPESAIRKTAGGARINGRAYRVPAVTAASGDLSMKRLDPRANEVQIFSPYMIHGSAANLRADATRVSLEVRLCQV